MAHINGRSIHGAARDLDVWVSPSNTDAPLVTLSMGVGPSQKPYAVIVPLAEFLRAVAEEMNSSQLAVPMKINDLLMTIAKSLPASK